MKAINFDLKDKEGKTHSLDNTKDYTVLYFYPKDNTPGCTLEAKSFENDLERYDRLNSRVIGVSGGDEKSKQKFCEKNNLTLLLLSDTDYKLSTNYGVYGAKKFMGREYMGISRTTFILDRNLEIIKKFENVNPLNHSKEVLEFIEEVKNGKHK